MKHLSSSILLVGIGMAFSMAIAFTNTAAAQGSGPGSEYLLVETIQPISCNGEADGALKVTPLAGQPPYTYAWSTGATTQSISGLAAGPYSVTVQDNLNRSATVEITLDEPETLTSTAIATPSTTCGAESDGTLTATPSGGTAPYKFSWSQGYTQANVNNATPGMHTVEITDDHDCVTTASAEVILDDQTPPTIAVQNLTIYLDDDGVASITANDVDNGTADACSAVTTTLAKTDFTCIDLGIKNIAFTAEDASGNTASANVQITVLDSIAPVVNFRSQPTIYIGETGTATVVVDDIIESSSDNCAVVAQTANLNTVSCADIGPKTISVLVEDASGNYALAQTTVMVLDTLKPTFTLETIELELDAEGNATLTEAMLMPYADDNCGIAEIAIQTPVFSCAILDETGTTEIIVFDNHGNLIQRTLYVTLTDSEGPVAVVEDQSIALDDNGMLALSADNVEHSSTDNCAIGTVTFSPAQFTCADAGPHEVTMTVTDLGGNTSSATFNVTPIDETPPQFTCTESVFMCEGALQSPGVVATDNCGATTVQTGGPVPGAMLEAGTYTLQYTATDLSGNSATCEVPVTVVASIAVDLGEDRTEPAGTIITLTAGPDNGTEYLWTTGETTPTIEFELVEDVVIGVTATLEGCSGEDEIVITLADPDGIAEVGPGEYLRFFPNPTQSTFYVAFDTEEVQHSVVVHLTDVNGRTIHNEHPGTVSPGQRHAIDLSAMPQGIYLITVQTEKFVRTDRIIKR